MNNFEKLTKIHQLHKLIKSNFEGNTNKYAEKIGISRSCFLNYKELLEDAGAIIEYSRIMNQYVYMNDFDFEMKVTFAKIEDIEMNKIMGGLKNSHSPLF